MDFTATKLLWNVLQPGNLLVMATWIAAVLAWRGRRGTGWAAVLVAAAATATAVLPIGAWLVAPLEDRFPRIEPPPRIDGIVLLGGAEDLLVAEGRGGIAFNDSAERVIEFAALARRYPGARLGFTGGSGLLRGTALSEAEIERRALSMLGIDTRRVTFEDRSRNTFENAINLRALMRPEPDQTWLLVTSARHMPRAVGVFRAQDWPVFAHTADYRTSGETWRLGFDFAGHLSLITDGVREWTGLIAYWAAGRIATPFPGPEDDRR